MAEDLRIPYAGRENVKAFLTELAALTAEYKLEIQAPCNCCGGLHLVPVREDDKIGTYDEKRESDDLRRKERVYEIKFKTARPR